MADFNLDRFVTAQAACYAQALGELRQGRKQGHWMWFVFPQIAGLGHSGMARRYAIGSADEARAYLAHPSLGARLIECTEATLGHRGRPAEAIFGAIDALKFRSSMTLFETSAQTPHPFADALEQFYGGQRDSATLGLIAAA